MREELLERKGEKCQDLKSQKIIGCKHLYDLKVLANPMAYGTQSFNDVFTEALL
jgi:hypothetical protein